MEDQLRSSFLLILSQLRAWCHSLILANGATTKRLVTARRRICDGASPFMNNWYIPIRNFKPIFLHNVSFFSVLYCFLVN